jgi:hypothetical protein
MATTSFNKDFVISDEKSVIAFQVNLTNPRKIKVVPRDLKADKIKGIKLLKQRLSVLETC